MPKILIEIDTDEWAVVPRVPTEEMCRHAHENAMEKASFSLAHEVYEWMLAVAPQPEQAQLSDFDPIVPEFALEVGAKAVELAMQAGVTSPRTLALAAYTDIALTLHKAGQQPAPRQIPPINQELDEFISGLVAKELAKRGSRKIETAPLPEPANVEQAQQDGTVINYGTMVSDEFLACFDSAFSFLANGHSIGQCFDMMKFAKAELIKSKKNNPAPRPVPTCDWQEDADGIWETSCGEAWVCTEGTPAENNMKFCHSCGKHLKEHRYAEPDGGAV